MKPALLLALPLALASTSLLATAAGPPRGALRVRTSLAVAPCVAAAAPLFERTAGRPVAIETAVVGPVASGEGADVLVAVEEELTRVIEGLASHPDMDVEVAKIPWVWVTRDGRPPDLAALARSGVHVRVLGGAIARHARQSLESLPPDGVETVRGEAGIRLLGTADAALVPLSLAGRDRVSATTLPPLLVRAVGLRAATRPDAARAFLAFLAEGPGNDAFVRCGRDGAR